MSRIEDEQNRLNHDMGRLQMWGQQHPRRFSGLWFQGRNRRGRRRATVVVAVIGDVDAAATELRGIVQHPDRLEVIAGRHAKAAVMAVRDQVMRDWMPADAPAADDTHVTTLGVDQKEGRVLIGLNRVDQDFAARLLSQYGSEWVRVKDEPQNVVPL